MKVILEMIKENERTFIILKVVTNMKEIGEILIKKEKVYFIGMMVKGMKEIGKIVKEKEKEFFIIITVIEEWVIILMINRQESMLDLLKMEK